MKQEDMLINMGIDRIQEIRIKIKNCEKHSNKEIINKIIHNNNSNKKLENIQEYNNKNKIRIKEE